MKLCQFTGVDPQGIRGVVHINPQHVVAVYSVTAGTMIITLALQQNSAFRFVVSDPLDQVVSALSAAG